MPVHCIVLVQRLSYYVMCCYEYSPTTWNVGMPLQLVNVTIALGGTLYKTYILVLYASAWTKVNEYFSTTSQHNLTGYTLHLDILVLLSTVSYCGSRIWQRLVCWALTESVGCMNTQADNICLLYDYMCSVCAQARQITHAMHVFEIAFNSELLSVHAVYTLQHGIFLNICSIKRTLKCMPCSRYTCTYLLRFFLEPRMHITH